MVAYSSVNVLLDFLPHVLIELAFSLRLTRLKIERTTLKMLERFIFGICFRVTVAKS